MKYIAHIKLGSRQRWSVLARKWREQGKRCAYSGRELILGINASVDHIVPVSKNKGSTPSEENLHWTDARVNQMKIDFDEGEFLLLVGDIARHSAERIARHDAGEMSAEWRLARSVTFFGRKKKRADKKETGQGGR